MLLCQIVILVQTICEGIDQTVDQDVDEATLSHSLLSDLYGLAIKSHWIRKVIALVQYEEDHAFE